MTVAAPLDTLPDVSSDSGYTSDWSHLPPAKRFAREADAPPTPAYATEWGRFTSEAPQPTQDD